MTSPMSATLVHLDTITSAIPQPRPMTVFGVDLGSGERSGGHPIDYEEHSYSHAAPDESCFTIDPLQRKFREAVSNGEYAQQRLTEMMEELAEAASDFEKVRSINSALRSDNYGMFQEIKKIRDDVDFWRDQYNDLSSTVAKLKEENARMALELSSIYRDEEHAA